MKEFRECDSIANACKCMARNYSKEWKCIPKMYFACVAFTGTPHYLLTKALRLETQQKPKLINNSFIFPSITHATSSLLYLRNINHTISLMQDLRRSRSSLVRPAWFTSLFARVTNRLEITRRYRGWNMKYILIHILKWSVLFVCDCHHDNHDDSVLEMSQCRQLRSSVVSESLMKLLVFNVACLRSYQQL